MPLSSITLSEKSERSTKVKYSRVLKYVLRRDLVFYYLCALANMLSVAIIFSYVAVYMIEEFGLYRSTYAIIVFLLTTTFGVSSVFAGKFCDKSAMLSGLVGTVGILISAILMIISGALVHLVLALILFEILSAFAYNPLYVVLSKRLPENVKGSGINLADTMLNISFLVLPALEFIVESYGAKSALLLPVIISILAIVSSIHQQMRKDFDAH